MTDIVAIWDAEHVLAAVLLLPVLRVFLLQAGSHQGEEQHREDDQSRHPQRFQCDCADLSLPTADFPSVNFVFAMVNEFAFALRLTHKLESSWWKKQGIASSARLLQGIDIASSCIHLSLTVM